MSGPQQATWLAVFQIRGIKMNNNIKQIKYSNLAFWCYEPEVIDICHLITSPTARLVAVATRRMDVFNSLFIADVLSIYAYTS
jgi:hypothetical protein